MTQGNSSQKVLIWALGALSSMGVYFSAISMQRVADLKEIISALSTEGRTKDDRISYERKQKDSLQRVIVERSDKSFQELKDILTINEDKNNTIIIKPKRK